jgi:YggT family protein
MADRRKVVERRVYDDGYEVRKSVENEGAVRADLLRRVQMLIWLVTAALVSLISLRIILRLIDANPTNDFANFIYDLSGVFVDPFNTLINNPGTGTGSVFEITSIIAIVVYVLVAYLIVFLLGILFGRSHYSSGTTVVERNVDLD